MKLYEVFYTPFELLLPTDILTSSFYGFIIEAFCFLCCFGIVFTIFYIPLSACISFFGNLFFPKKGGLK